MRRVRRSLVMAAVLGLAAGGLMATPAVAEPPWQPWHGIHCGGIQVDRCAWLDWDPGGRRVRAGGNTRDEPGGGNHSVAVNDVAVQVLVPFEGWRTITRVGDYDGWHSVWDSATSSPAGVWCGWQYRALTRHRWTGASTGGEWIASDPVTFC